MTPLTDHIPDDFTDISVYLEDYVGPTVEADGDTVTVERDQ